MFNETAESINIISPAVGSISKNTTRLALVNFSPEISVTKLSFIQWKMLISHHPISKFFTWLNDTWQLPSLLYELIYLNNFA